MHKSKYIIWFFILMIVFSIFTNEYSFAEENKDSKKTVYIVVMNKYTLEDIDNMPKLKKIIDEGSIGLMNTKGLYGYKGPESFLTINSSKKAYTTDEGAKVYNLNENNVEVYERRIAPIEGSYEVGNTNLNKIIESNKENTYVPYIGALGDSLHEDKLKTAIFGNADTIDKVYRPSSLIPMDSRGLIDFGNVDSVLIADSEAPYGFRTDYDKLIEEIGKVKDESSLIVIETGDLDRLSFYSSELTDEMFEKHRTEILYRIDVFLENLIEGIDKDNSLLIILSPNSGEERIQNSKISPAIIWGNNIPKGILTSSTTKRDGVITNIDIAPTIANFLNASREKMSGNTVDYKQNTKNLEFILNSSKRIDIVSRSRFYLLSIYSTISIIGILFATIVLALKIKIKNNLYKTLKLFLITIGIMPVGFLLVSFGKWDTYIQFILTLLLMMVSLIFIACKLKGNNKAILISGLIYVIIIVDMFSGSNLARYSVLGHDPTIGARYFGLGNELVGVFLGATTVFLSMILNKGGNKFISYILLLLSAIIVGHPKLGANVGGTISIVFALLYFIMESLDREMSLKKILSMGILTILFVMAMAFIDIKFNPNPTHLGKTIMMMNSDGNSIANNIALRKIIMNIKLVGSSIWTKSLYVNIFCQVLITTVLGDKIRDIFNKNKYLFIGFTSGIVGSIVGFLVNDSGIILAALAMNLIMIFFIYTMMEHLVNE